VTGQGTYSVDAFERRKRHLPHWEAPGETYFITFCLARPPAVDLTEDRFASLVVTALRHFDGSRYVLYDYFVMPDHVHCILQPTVADGRTEPLSGIMQSLKGWLARQINAAAGRRGKLWQTETYDHLLRNVEDYEEKSAYILENPFRRGLVQQGAAWAWWGRGSGVV